MKRLPAGFASLLLVTGGCSSSTHAGAPGVSAQPDGGAASAPDGAVATDAGARDAADAAPLDVAGIIAARPYTLHFPAGYDAGEPAPLLVLFHGYGADGPTQELYFEFTPSSDAYGFLYAYGDGLVDPSGSRFWNATDGCCNFYDAGVDDVAYFDAILADVSSKANVDPKRIFVVGHSNGGFMAHRLACERTNKVAAIVSLAGAVYNDPTMCNPSGLVAVAQVHGTADATILYDGGATTEGPYPSAPQTAATWAKKNGCTGSLTTTTTLDLDSSLPGNETAVQVYGGCPAGNAVELWTIDGGVHEPFLSHPVWGDAVWGFLSAHPKP